MCPSEKTIWRMGHIWIKLALFIQILPIWWSLHILFWILLLLILHGTWVSTCFWAMCHASSMTGTWAHCALIWDQRFPWLCSEVFEHEPLWWELGVEICHHFVGWTKLGFKLPCVDLVCDREASDMVNKEKKAIDQCLTTMQTLCRAKLIDHHFVFMIQQNNKVGAQNAAGLGAFREVVRKLTFRESGTKSEGSFLDNFCFDLIGCRPHGKHFQRKHLVKSFIQVDCRHPLAEWIIFWWLITWQQFVSGNLKLFCKMHGHIWKKEVDQSSQLKSIFAAHVHNEKCLWVGHCLVCEIVKKFTSRWGIWLSDNFTTLVKNSCSHSGVWKKQFVLSETVPKIDDSNTSASVTNLSNIVQQKDQLQQKWQTIWFSRCFQSLNFL